MKHIVLIFCRDLEKDPVSAHVLQRVLKLKNFEETDLFIDGQPILRHQSREVLYHLLRLDMVLSHAYRRYAGFLNNNFGCATAIIIVNWHQGQKAPNAIFTVQTTGDMASGRFSPVNPAVTRGLFLAIEDQRQRVGLTDFSTWMEATHWSGSVYGGQTGDMVAALNPSVIDLEIGSCLDDWSNPLAADVLAQAVFHIFDDASGPVLSLLCVGGTHFELGFTQLLRDYGRTQRIALSHVLPNHWLVANNYDEPGRLTDLLTCVRSIVGGTQAVVFHDNLKGSFKEQVRRLADELSTPALSHKKLRMSDIASVIRDAAQTE